MLDVLQWARENGCPWDAGTCINAAAGGNLELLQWLREQGGPWNAQTVRSLAIACGYMEILQWMKGAGNFLSKIPPLTCN
jgi:hypothetical protein